MPITLRCGVLCVAAILSLARVAIDAHVGDVLRVEIAGAAVADARVQSVAVNSAAAGVDEANVTLDKSDTRSIRVGEPVRVEAVSASGGAVELFDGEVVSTGLEGKPLDGSPLVVRALNRLHRLDGGRKTRTFESRSDSDIARVMAEEAGLTFASAGLEAEVTHERLVQHDQTDLEFLRSRAARVGYEVFVNGSTLYFIARRDPAVVALGCSVRVFHPRLSAPSQIAAVTVRGWDPQRQQEIAGTATRRILRLSEAGTHATATLRVTRVVDLGFVPALATEATAHATAFGALSGLTAADLSGEANVDGNPLLRAGATIEIDQTGARFDGKYLLTGVSHRFNRGSSSGYHTLLRVLRVDRGIFVLPGVDDEVLVAFEHGDLSRPVIVGSLWDEDDDAPAERRPCSRP